jgi:hypothetical protein
MEFIQMAPKNATGMSNERVETQTVQELAREGRAVELKKRIVANPELVTKVDDVRVCGACAHTDCRLAASCYTGRRRANS